MSSIRTAPPVLGAWTKRDSPRQIRRANTGDAGVVEEQVAGLRLADRRLRPRQVEGVPASATQRAGEHVGDQPEQSKPTSGESPPAA